MNVLLQLVLSYALGLFIINLGIRLFVNPKTASWGVGVEGSKLRTIMRIRAALLIIGALLLGLTILFILFLGIMGPELSYRLTGDLDMLLSDALMFPFDILGSIFSLNFFIVPVTYLLLIVWLAFITIRVFPKVTIGHRVFLSAFWILTCSNLALTAIEFFPWGARYSSFSYGYFVLSTQLVGLSVIGFATPLRVVRPIQRPRRWDLIFLYVAPCYLFILLIWALVLALLVYAIIAVLLSTAFGFAGAYYRRPRLLILNGSLLWILGWWAMAGSVGGMFLLLPAILLMTSGLRLAGTVDTTYSQLVYEPAQKDQLMRAVKVFGVTLGAFFCLALVWSILQGIFANMEMRREWEIRSAAEQLIAKNPKADEKALTRKFIREAKTHVRDPQQFSGAIIRLPGGGHEVKWCINYSDYHSLEVFTVGTKEEDEFSYSSSYRIGKCPEPIEEYVPEIDPEPESFDEFK